MSGRDRDHLGGTNADCRRRNSLSLLPKNTESEPGVKTERRVELPPHVGAPPMHESTGQILLKCSYRSFPFFLLHARIQEQAEAAHIHLPFRKVPSRMRGTGFLSSPHPFLVSAPGKGKWTNDQSPKTGNLDSLPGRNLSVS